LDNTPIDLVSVITRSMDRSTLQETLDSIAAQTYPNIEVILVNARGDGHSEYGEKCGEFPLRMVRSNGPLQRSSAANLGLDSAQGTYALFLDDDDWLDPDHIEALVAALAENKNTPAAYAGVRFTSTRESIEFSVINEAFNPIRLLHGNFIPIHAVLFRKNLAQRGCRFDESLALYEDWDFWLQVARFGPFLHLDRVSAGYRSDGGSGAGPSVGEDTVQAARDRIFEKWRQIWTGNDISQLLAFASHIEDPKISKLEEKLEASGQLSVSLNQLLVKSNFRFAELEIASTKLHKDNIELQRQIAERDAKLHELGTLVQTFSSSISWRLTAPLRRTRFAAAAFAIRARHAILRARRVMSYLLPLAQDPRRIPPTFLRLKVAWQKGGVGSVKAILKQLPYEVTYNQVWVNQYKQSFTPEVVAQLQTRIRSMVNPPLISVLMPTFNTPEAVLRDAIKSVTSQLYSNWELCIVDDASPQPRVRSVLEELAKNDVRLRLLILEKNAGVATATNHALAMARGVFVVLLDHDDVLEPQALFRVAEAIQSTDPDMIYSDEATLSEDGKEVINHTHRPAFSLEYLRACPYIVHLVAFRTEMVRQIGGLDATLAISQDYDLILRMAERARKIVHIPEILYFWRERKLSSGHLRKATVMDTSREVLTRHLARCGEVGQVHNGLLFNYFDVRYALKSDQKVAIIIPTKNHGELVRQCVESIVRTVKQVAYEIVIVDHASDDPASIAYFEQLKSHHQVLRYEGVFNFSAINNWAISHMHGDFSHYLFCNNDIEAMDADWLERMLELGQMPDVGLVGAKLLYPDRKMIQHAGVCVGMYGVAEHYGKFMDDVLPNGSLHPGYHGTLIANHEMSAVTAACALMRRDVFERIGGYEKNLPVGFGDVDLCLKTREAGYRVLFCAQAVLVHHESYTRGKSREDPHPEDSAYFVKKWRKTLDQCDPYYNPNLTVQSTQWEVRQPVVFNLDIANRVWQRPPAAAHAPVQ
jgi:glycosyltransferase involved in cell wall biosynthesis